MNLIPSEIKIAGETFLSNPEVSDAISFILSPGLQEKFFILQLISFFVCFFLVIAIVFLLRKSDYSKWHRGDDLKDMLAFKPDDSKKSREYYINYWRKIIKRLEANSESEYKLAIIKADHLLDYVLKEKGYDGKSLEDRLRQVEPGKISDLNSIWKVHKICDNIPHDAIYKLDIDEAKRILAVYKKTFQDLGIF
ncbi:hypothetical protein KAS79_03375 [Candidatus Parcubacteria bacterium]|nr:hypothetical protein [Candidatus Parcubacteria bacterium]